MITTESFSFLVAIRRGRLRLLLSRLTPIVSLSSNTTKGTNSGSEGGESSNGILDQQLVTLIDRKSTINLAAETIGRRRRIGQRGETTLGTTVTFGSALSTVGLLEARSRDGFSKVGSGSGRKIRGGTVMQPPGTDKGNKKTQQPTNQREKCSPVGSELGDEVGPEGRRKSTKEISDADSQEDTEERASNGLRDDQRDHVNKVQTVTHNVPNGRNEKDRDVPSRRHRIEIIGLGIRGGRGR